MSQSYLNIEIDIKQSDDKKTPDLVVKIPRPRKVKVEEKPSSVSDEFVKQSNPNVTANISTLNRESYNIPSVSSEEEIENVVKTVDWGDYDVDKLVEVMCHLSQAITSVELKPYQLPIQKRIFRSILLNEGLTITALISRQAGKSEAAACSITTLCVVMPTLARHFPEQLGQFKNGFKVGIYAPAGEQAKTLYDRVKARANSESALNVYEDPDVNTSIDRHGCKWKNGSFVLMQSASPKANIESKSYDMIVCDESQDLDDFVVNKSIYPMLAWGNGTMVMIGTVSEKPCLFYETIQQNTTEDVNKSLDTKAHFEFRWNEVVKYNPKYQVHIDNMKKKHGEHSKYFQMAYNLKWYFEEGRAVTDVDLKQYTMGIKVGLTAYTQAPVVVGIDLARKTNGSVVTIGQLMGQESIYEDGDVERFVTVKVCDWLELENLPYPQQRPLMKDFISRYPNVIAIAVDCTGVGDAIFAEMQEEWNFYCQMIPFLFSSKSKHQLMNLYYEFMWKNRLIIPSTDEVRRTNKWQRFYLQMINLERITQNGYTYLSKSTRQGARDDYPDSLFLMLHAAKEGIKNSGQIETADIKNLYKIDSLHQSGGGFQNFRERVRSGGYMKNSVREQRAQKLLQGVL